MPKHAGFYCTVVRVFGSTCRTTVLDVLRIDPRGPQLVATQLYYYWDGSVDSNFPVHDPCGMNGTLAGRYDRCARCDLAAARPVAVLDAGGAHDKILFQPGFRTPFY